MKGEPRPAPRFYVAFIDILVFTISSWRVGCRAPEACRMAAAVAEQYPPQSLLSNDRQRPQNSSAQSSCHSFGLSCCATHARKSLRLFARYAWPFHVSIFAGSK